VKVDMDAARVVELLTMLDEYRGAVSASPPPWSDNDEDYHRFPTYRVSAMIELITGQTGLKPEPRPDTEDD
jgi:hypothetical protein